MKKLCSILLSLCMALAWVSCHDDVLSGAGAQPKVVLNGEGCYDFETVLSGCTSATKRLIIYNENPGVLELQSIVLRGGKESAFRVNVDGMAGTTFDRPELLHIDRGDSLFVLMEVSAPLPQQERTVALEDYLDIACNGRTTSILLRAEAVKVETLQDYTLTGDERWDATGLDKRIVGQLTIPEGRTLTVNDSLRLYMHAGASIEVYGTLVLQGSRQGAVRLLGDRQDKMFDNLYYHDMVGQWGGIHLHPSSKDCLFEYVDMKGMTTGIVADTTALTLRNAIVKNSNASLIVGHDAQLTLENSCLMNSGEPLVALHGGTQEIVHCTLANYQFWAAYPEHDLLLHNCRCQLVNTLIYGNSQGPDIGLDYDETYAEGEAPYHFDHCLLNAKGEDDLDFVSVIWGEDPLFVRVDMPNYVCDPHLQAESPARGKGTAATLSRLPSDLDGKPRGEHPSIGCYE